VRATAVAAIGEVGVSHAERIALSSRWPGFTEAGSVVIEVPPEAWPPPTTSLEIEGRVFEPKSELHVTIAGKELGKRIRELPGLDTIFEAQDWWLRRTTEHLRIGKQKPEGYVETIIERVELPALAMFIDAVSKALGEPVETPPAHVTLFTSGDPEGIGIPDEEALRQMFVERIS
jgi:hypothetical protein